MKLLLLINVHITKSYDIATLKIKFFMWDPLGVIGRLS